jgi:hypothetical protein
VGSPIIGVDLAGCINTCANNTNCVAVSSSGVACYLKGTVNYPEEYNMAVNAAVLVGSYNASTTQITATPVRTATVAPAPTNYGTLCPASNGTEYTASCGSTYAIECGIDRVDGDRRIYPTL